MRKYSLQISIVIAVFFWLLMSSCGTRQAEVVRKDSISINNSYSQGEKIIFGNTFTFTPIDALKPIKIDGKEYHNAIITNDKSKVIEKWKNRNITKTITVEKTKKSEKSDNTILWIGIAAVVVMGVVAYLKL